jgi:hypothetical protein
MLRFGNSQLEMIKPKLEPRTFESPGSDI